MKKDSINNSISERICNHMNADHKDAVNSYAVHYGGIKDFKEAKLISLNSHFMALDIDSKIIHIKFDHTLEDSNDAHRTLVSMLKSIPKDNGG
tara:strand:+ start:5440 stop:5718 length:279 start_codon:yes stop_codon:yes gene_type:complete